MGKLAMDQKVVISFNSFVEKCGVGARKDREEEGNVGI